MFLNVYLRFQDFIFSPKIGYIEEKMKNTLKGGKNKPTFFKDKKG